MHVHERVMKMAKSKEYQQAKKQFMRKLQFAHDLYSPTIRKMIEPFCDEYRAFLDAAKTERLAATEIVRLVKKAGFRELTAKSKSGNLFAVYRGKVVAVAVRGKQSTEEGVNLVISHIDSPRLDLKQNPLYEDLNVGMLKTHYYGGIRKHQWVTRPLAIYGVVVKADGTMIDIAIGDDPADPCFTVLDLLPHLAAKAQADKKIKDAIPGEKLNVVFGGRPLGKHEDGKDRIKLNILRLLGEKYGLVEEDFTSAELEVVPVGQARNVGIDGAFIGAYGHDDRICAYTSLRGILDIAKQPQRTAVCLFMDKEEIGSKGNTGAEGRFLLDFLGDLLALEGKDSERAIRRALANSQVLSADVNAAINPDWPEVHDKRNAAHVGRGICLTKFTGARGKAGSSDAHAEFVGKVRLLLNKHKVPWQTGELGKVDEGGGGTVAAFFARHGADVLDAGPALLAMHSPFELAHKDDVYSAFLTYRTFLEKA